MEIVQLAVIEGPNEYSQDAVLAVDLRQGMWEGAHRHRLSAFHELVISMLRSFRAPGTHQESSPLGIPWQRSAEELLAYAITALHRAADLEVQARTVPVEGEGRRIVVQPAGSRATRWAVEFVVSALRDFSAGRSVDMVSGVNELRRLAVDGQRAAHAAFY